MNKWPRISIITPSYNQAAFIEQTIKSVVNQKYPNLEYFIMDGGSIDGSVDIIKNYAHKYPDIIKWQSKKDKGQVDAINQALDKASGDIIAYLNSDDCYLPDAFNQVVKFFRENPKVLWVVGNCKITDSKLKWTFTVKHFWPIDKIKSLLYFFNWVNQPAVFLQKKLVEKVGNFDMSYHYAFDYDYWLRCLDSCLPGRLHKNLATFRIHQSSKGNTGYIKQFQEDQTVVRKYTNNPLLLLGHYINTKLVFLNYRFLK